ncbi:MAG: hypothetical protein QW303_00255 [Nitrososphaerota archaeon]
MTSSKELNKENLLDVKKTSENFCIHCEQNFNANLVSQNDAKFSEKVEYPNNSFQEKKERTDTSNHEECSEKTSFAKSVKGSDPKPEESPLGDGRKKRGPPKTILANQQKYLAALERQQRMINKKEKKRHPIKMVRDRPTIRKIDGGVRRVIVGGKVKYFAIKEQPEKLCSFPESNHEPTNADKNELVYDERSSIPLTIAKKMELYREKIDPETSKKMNGLAFKSGEKKIPSKYAKEMERDVKKQTIKNVKNFSDLRRITTIQNLADNGQIDTNKASIAELRRLRILQRKREQEEQKKNEASRRESIVQEILKNDKMSKFAKMVALKNLSVNSRRRWLLERKKEEHKRDTDNIQFREGT